MEMLTDVIVKHEIGGFTAATFAVALAGHRMELLAFTKFVLQRVGNFMFCI